MKKIISFSLWGNIRLYTIGAIKNALLAEKYFPDWICRFYYDSTVPQIIVDYLKSLDNVEMMFVEKPSGGTVYKDNGQFGMFWRFFPFNDDNVEVWMARDIDSRLSQYEYIEINKFLKTDKTLHSFRRQTEKMCRGCGTSFRNYVNGNDTRIINDEKLNLFDMISDVNREYCPFYTDENFLNNKLYPLYSDSYICSPRNYNNQQPDYCGPYVGGVVDEYDNRIDKNKTSEFNNQSHYNDLDNLLKNFKLMLYSE